MAWPASEESWREPWKAPGSSKAGPVLHSPSLAVRQAVPSTVGRSRALSISSIAPALVVAAVTIPVAIECSFELHEPRRSLHAHLQDMKLLAPGPIHYEPGHGFGLALGIVGAAAIVLLSLYSVRKRVPSAARFGRLPRWLDVHVTLGLVGPMLVLFHTAGRLGGIVSVAFWSMVVVVTSGVVGRYVYAQVPRTIAGRERSLADLSAELGKLEAEIPELSAARGSHGWERSATGRLGDRNAGGALGWFVRWTDMSLAGLRERRALNHWLAEQGLDRDDRHAVLARVRRAEELRRQVSMLESTRRWVARWHALHVPLVGVLYAILAIHIAVMILFRAR